MTIKSKISLYISIIFTILFGMICLLVITLFSDYRKQEFKERLREKAYSDIRLLVEVKEVSETLLKIIDQNTINELYSEKTLIFDGNFKLIYSSLDDTRIKWSMDDLRYLKKHKTFFKQDGKNEIYGVFYDSNQKDYYALISANDNYGHRKQEYLSMLLLGAYILFTVMTWILTFRIVKKQLSPVDRFHGQIKLINARNLNSQLLFTKRSKNEINLLSEEFNYMIKRIAEAYDKQKEFTAQASHELRTPLARLTARIENQLSHADEAQKPFLLQINEDISKLNELINSLLILSKLENKDIKRSEKTRLDEALFNSMDKVREQFPDFRMNLDLAIEAESETFLELRCNQQLLEIAFLNLLRNACLYSDSKSAHIRIGTEAGRLSVTISNDGATLSEAEQTVLFEPFMRAKNAGKKSGLGLGLRIVYRICTSYGYEIQYAIRQGMNEFRIDF